MLSDDGDGEDGEMEAGVRSEAESIANGIAEGRPVTPGGEGGGDGSARMGTKGTESQGFFVGNC